MTLKSNSHQINPQENKISYTSLEKIFGSVLNATGSTEKEKKSKKLRSSKTRFHF